MTIYEALPKVQIPGVGMVTAFIDAPLDFSAESQEFSRLTNGFECPLSDANYTKLLQSAPPGWAEAFGILKPALSPQRGALADKMDTSATS